MTIKSQPHNQQSEEIIELEMKKIERLEITASRINNAFEGKNSKVAAAVVHAEGITWIDLRNDGTLFMELHYDGEWIIEPIFPVALKLLKDILNQIEE